jgi:aspartyl-tRNA(Asn)/glutamyl-tRNA(Gln) amidotransferase subunit A
LAGEDPMPLREPALSRLCLGVPQRYVLDGLDRAVAEAFARSLSRLSGAGARIFDVDLAELEEIPRLMQKGALVAIEAYAVHRELLARSGAEYDPRVANRIRLGSSVSAADYIELLQRRAELIARVARITADYDAVLCPTVPVVAPPIAPLERDDELYLRTNLRVLRNTTAFNVLDRCAASLPIHAPGEAPVGLMVVGETMGDRDLLAIAATLERALSQ